MTKPVAEQLEPLEAELARLPRHLRDLVEREVYRAVGRWKGIRCSSPSDATRARLRLEVLQRHKLSGVLRPRPVENPPPPNEYTERLREAE